MSEKIFTYKLDLNNPEDKEEFDTIQSAEEYKEVVHRLSEELRMFFKYDATTIFQMQSPVSEECYSLAENIRARLFELCNEQGIKII